MSMTLRKGKRIYCELQETDEDVSVKHRCMEYESDDFDSIADRSNIDSDINSDIDCDDNVDSMSYIESDSDFESDIIDTSLADILESFSSSNVTKEFSSFSWDHFQGQISKHPEQITPLLFHQILMIHNPIVPLEVITTSMTANPNAVSGEAVKFLACTPWISLDHVDHIISLEQSNALHSDDSDFIDLSFAEKWLKVFEIFQHEDAPPPRFQVTGKILQWLTHELIIAHHDDPEIIFSRYSLLMTSHHANHLKYLVQVLESFMDYFQRIEDSEERHAFHESFLRVICDSIISRILSDWSDKDAELAIRKIFTVAQMTEYGITRITNSTALSIAFIKSKFETAKFLILSCPYSIIGGEPFSDSRDNLVPKSIYPPDLMKILTKDDHREQRLALVQCFIETYINLTLNNLEFDYSAWDVMIGNRIALSCGGLFRTSYFHYWQDWRKYQTPAFILFSKHSEQSDRFFCDLVHFLLDFDKSGSKGFKVNNVLSPCIEWHLMAIIRCFIEHRKWDLIDWTVNEYPIILHAQSRHEKLGRKNIGSILHLLGHSNRAPAALIQSIIQQGVKYGIDRGGLMIKNELDEVPLELICKKKGREIMSLYPFLLNSQNPKLITVTDIKEGGLFHAVSRGGQCTFAVKLLKLCPKVLGIADENGRLPLHYVLDPLSPSNPSFFRLLLKEGLRQGVGGKVGMAGLLVKDIEGLTPIDLLVMRAPDARSSLLKVLFEGIVSNVPFISALLTQPMLHEPKPENSVNRNDRRMTNEMFHWIYSRQRCDEKVLSIVTRYEKYNSIPDTNGRLPIHIAIEKCFGEMGTELSLNRHFPWHKESCKHISDAAKAYLVLRNSSSCLLCIDPITGLFPYQMIASKEELRVSNSETRNKRITLLTEIFIMLRLEPAVVFR